MRGAWILLLIPLGSCGDDDADRGEATLFDAPAAGVSAPAERLEIPAEAPTVAFLGDSIGAGLHLAEHQSFPAVLQRRLSDEQPFHLVNASESGRTTAGGLTALKWVLRSEPDLLVIELGGNDGLRFIPLETVEANLRAMIAGAREAGAEVLLLGVRLPPNYKEYGAAFDALYPRLAEELEVAFVPFFMEGVGGVAEMNQDDLLHPTAQGQELLAARIEPTLREVLQGLDDPGSP